MIEIIKGFIGFIIVIAILFFGFVVFIPALKSALP